jgi:hypothetical protein
MDGYGNFRGASNGAKMSLRFGNGDGCLDMRRDAQGRTMERRTGTSQSNSLSGGDPADPATLLNHSDILTVVEVTEMTFILERKRKRQFMFTVKANEDDPHFQRFLKSKRED